MSSKSQAQENTLSENVTHLFPVDSNFASQFGSVNNTRYLQREKVDLDAFLRRKFESASISQKHDNVVSGSSLARWPKSPAQALIKLLKNRGVEMFFSLAEIKPLVSNVLHDFSKYYGGGEASAMEFALR